MERICVSEIIFFRLGDFGPVLGGVGVDPCPISFLR